MEPGKAGQKAWANGSTLDGREQVRALIETGSKHFAVGVEKLRPGRKGDWRKGLLVAMIQRRMVKEDTPAP